MSDRIRCAWAPAGDELYAKYHDEEWGVPVHDDRVMFEFLVLESAQAGLSWKTVLNKRENYRRLFVDFDPVAIAKFDDDDVERLLLDSGIIRNRAKVEATIQNAKAFLKVQNEFESFAKYLWGFVNGEVIDGKRKTIKDLPSRSEVSDVLAKDLKKRGFSFLGSTVCYAHLQATGLINDHVEDCFRYRECSRLS
ncbi:MAG: DNA-3-methyladenine glycosylase I [Patescibacteria group bacterium]